MLSRDSIDNLPPLTCGLPIKRSDYQEAANEQNLLIFKKSKSVGEEATGSI